MKIKIESHERYGKCRVCEGWAVALDVARILGYVKGTTFANKHVAKEDKRYEPVRALNSTKVAKTLLINKTGVAAMTAASANVEAEEIKTWILSVMVPQQVAAPATPADNLQIVEVEGVRGYIAPNGVAWLNVEHVACGLGFVDIQEKVSATNGRKTYEVIRWARINDYLAEFGFPHVVGKGDFIPENIFYLLAMKANNATAKTFQLKVANDILPAIRKDGCYVAPEQNNNLLQAQINTLKAENALLRNQLPALSSLAMAVVYVLLISNGSIKIGVTDCLPRRIKEIELETNLRVLNFKSTPYLLRNEAENLESFLKDKFSAQVLSGEFFSARFDEVTALIS